MLSFPAASAGGSPRAFSRPKSCFPGGRREANALSGPVNGFAPRIIHRRLCRAPGKNGVSKGCSGVNAFRCASRTRIGYIKVTSDRGLANFALFDSRDALSAVPPKIVP